MTEADIIADRRESFGASLRRLRTAQKSSKGAPPYSIFVNRPIGRVFAAAAFQAGLTPNTVTVVSAVFTFAGIAVLALVPPTAATGIAVALLLVLGYALDSADGQLARLRGGGSRTGEWLDHMIDATKISVLPLAVIVSAYRFTDLPRGWLLVPMAFAVASAVHFFGMVLVDLLAREGRALAGRPAPARTASPLPMTLAKLPTDYGIQCLAFVLLGATSLFAVVYTLLAAAMVGYTLLVARKWYGDVKALDHGPGAAPAPSAPHRRSETPAKKKRVLE